MWWNPEENKLEVIKIRKWMRKLDAVPEGILLVSVDPHFTFSIGVVSPQQPDWDSSLWHIMLFWTLWQLLWPWPKKKKKKSYFPVFYERGTNCGSSLEREASACLRDDGVTTQTGCGAEQSTCVFVCRREAEAHWASQVSRIPVWGLFQERLPYWLSL